MRMELLVIGNEVLTGFTVNTNASFIGQELLKEGYVLEKQTILPDREEDLLQELSESLKRSDVVITTGGLGPTIDDITRKSVAAHFASEFIFDENVAADLKKRYGENFPTIKDQATVPAKAKILINPSGTAPGFIFEKDGRALIVVPGVPMEMKPMLLEQALPYILKKFPLKTKVYKKALHLFELGEHDVDPLLRELNKKYTEVEFGIYPSLGVLTILVGAKAKSEHDAMKVLEEPFSELERNFATNCFTSKSGCIEETIHDSFLENQWTLSIAESCTGGHAASRITQMPGASEYFLGAVVPYSNALKTKILGVPEELIEEAGAVSKDVAAKMVEGVLRLTGSDFGLAVTGIAGPTGGTPEKPVGTVWCAVCRKGESPHTWKLQGRGTREMIITRSVNSLFSNLLIYIKETSLL